MSLPTWVDLKLLGLETSNLGVGKNEKASRLAVGNPIHS